ncbi:hypothetical protein C8Q80DRAFT_143768 [Daedaleopsis nitida]|nr:hypothetical protein C8Q80DRAFT_143768 [Daedaleopsis nitida]
MMPTELLEITLVDTWLHIPLFDPTQRWQFFATLSLVNHQFRAGALWVVTRHVRVLGNCSMDLAAYASIGRQHLALNPSSKAGSPHTCNEYRAILYQPSTVELDITFASFCFQQDRDMWLKDDVQPGRPDDEHKVFFDATALPDEPGFVYPLSDPVRAEEYKNWLSRRRRDRLSGWFAEFLDVVPDCRACIIISTVNDVESFTMSRYAMILESLWWWKSLATIGFRAVPGLEREQDLHFLVELMRGTTPCLPPLPSVTSVGISWIPRCRCLKSRGDMNAHMPECMTRRMLLPFVNLRHLRIEIERPEEVFPCVVTSELLAKVDLPTSFCCLVVEPVKGELRFTQQHPSRNCCPTAAVCR